MRIRATLTSLAAGLALVLALAPPASAQDKKRGDNGDDAAAAFNITSVLVQNHARTFALTVKVEDLRRSTGRLDVRLTPRDGGPVYGIEDVPVSRGRTTTRLTYAAGAGSREVLVACDGLAARRGLTVDKVRVEVPRRCLTGLPGTVVVSDLAFYPKRGERSQGDDLRTAVTTRLG